MNTRIRRLQLSGGAFHITARTQGREPWFAPHIRNHIAGIITAQLSYSDARLISFAVMPNHLHILLIQSMMTLGRLMQPILRRVALLVQQSQGLQGHVFERRFYSGLCETPDHVREVIAYTHRNPVTALLCETVDDYEWTSHACYATGSGPWANVCDWRTGLELFAERPEDGEAEWRASYLRWMARRGAGPDRSDVQLCLHGNRTFAARFSTISAPKFTGTDLRDAALKALAFNTTKYQMCQLMGSYIPRDAAAVRRQVIAFLLLAGYRTGRIAAFFGVSPATVSKIAYELKTARWKVPN